MGSNAKIKIITHWSIHIFLLLVMSRVKFVRLMSVDRVLSVQSNIHRNFNDNIKYNDNKQNQYQFKNNIDTNGSKNAQQNSETSQMLSDYIEEKKPYKDVKKKLDVHSSEGKNFISNEIIPYDDIDRTFNTLGNGFSHVLKQNEEIFKNMVGSMRPGTVDDVKSFNPFNYGEHLALDAYTNKKKPNAFKAPQITYEGFVPCSPPKCPTRHQTLSSPQNKPTDILLGTLAPNDVYIHTTVAPTEAPTNAIEETNMYESQPPKGKHHHNQGYHNDFHEDEHGHQLIDLIKPDYKYVHHEEGIQSVHPDPHPAPGVVEVKETTTIPTSQLKKNHDGQHQESDAINTHELVNSDKEAFREALENNPKPIKTIVNFTIDDTRLGQTGLQDVIRTSDKHQDIFFTNEEVKYEDNASSNGEVGHQLIDLIKDDYDYIHNETGIQENIPSFESVSPNKVVGHQLIDLIKDDYNYIHNETGIQEKNGDDTNQSKKALTSDSPFGNLSGQLKTKEVGHQVVDLIKEDYEYVLTTTPQSLPHDDIPSFERVNNVANTPVSGRNQIDHQLIDLIKEDYDYLNSTQNNEQLLQSNGTSENVNTEKIPHIQEDNNFPQNDPLYPNYYEYYGNHIPTYDDDYLDLSNDIQSNISEGKENGMVDLFKTHGIVGAFIPSQPNTMVMNIQQPSRNPIKPFVPVSAVIGHNALQSTNAGFSRPSFLVVSNPSITSNRLTLEHAFNDNVFQNEEDAEATSFLQEEHTNLGNQASIILGNNNKPVGNQIKPGRNTIGVEHLMLSNNIPTTTASPKEIPVTSNTVVLTSKPSNPPKATQNILNSSTTIMRPNEIAALFSVDETQDAAHENELQNQQNLFDDMHKNIPFKTHKPFPPHLLSEFMASQAAMKDAMLMDGIASPVPRRPKHLMPNFITNKLPSMQQIRMLQQQFGDQVAHFPLWREDFKSMPLLMPSRKPKSLNGNFIHHSPLGVVANDNLNSIPAFRPVALPELSNGNFVRQSPIGKPIKFRRGVKPKLKKGLKKIVKFKVHSITGQLIPVDMSVHQPHGTPFFTGGGQPIHHALNSIRQEKAINAFRVPPSQLIPHHELATLHSHKSGNIPSHVHHKNLRTPSSFAFISMLHGKRNKRRNRKHRV